MYNIYSGYCYMLYPFAIVKIQVLLNLTFLFPFCRLVDGKFYKPISISHYLTHELRVSGRNIIVIKTEDIFKSHLHLNKILPRDLSGSNLHYLHNGPHTISLLVPDYNLISIACTLAGKGLCNFFFL